MSRKQKFKPAVAVANRADDPYITSGAGSVQSDKFWRWGDDNLFPNALALMARRSVTHRRIINDKADYISGKGFSCDEGHEPLLAAFIRRVNGDGESLRQVLNKLAFDKALFGMRTAEEKFAGNPGQVMFVIRDGGEGDNSRFIPIASQNEGDWQALHEQAVSDIVVAHSWFRTLSGLDYASGFSAERILHEYEVALNTVILGEQAELTEPVREAITSILGIDASSLQVINRPPTRSKPIYMKVWEARKADGLDYDPDDERQQAFLSEITKYNIRSIE